MAIPHDQFLERGNGKGRDHDSSSSNTFAS